MINLYYWTTPNGHKITMFLEETGIEYRIVPVNIGRGEQFDPSFLQIAPNNRIPAIVDDQPGTDGESVSVFESGAILVYLAEKYGKLLPARGVERVRTMEWLIWQMANLGPMLGQNHHFVTYAPDKIPYAIDRYVNEASRLYAVLDRRLEGREFIVNTYSIADIACYPWIVPHERQLQRIDRFPNLKRWFEMIRDRSATSRAYAKGREINDQTTMSAEAKKVLFGQTDAVFQDVRSGGANDRRAT
jgi:GST-like protein